jgi:ribose transport system substrate-binding protein
MFSTRTLWAKGALAGSALVVLAACGGGAEPQARNDLASAGSEELHATVFDDELAKLDPTLPAIEVELANGITVPFEEGEKLKVAFNGYGKGFDYSVPEFDAALDMVEELDVEADEFDPGGDPQKQIAQLQDIMASGKYNAVVVYPLSPDLTCDLLTRQMPEKGILTVAIGNPACTTGDSAGVVTTIPDTGTTDYVYPAWTEQIAKLEEGGKAILVTGPELDFGAKIAGESAEEIFPEYDIELLALLRTDFTQADSLQKIQDSLQANPGVTTIASSFPEGTQAALTAVKMAGLQDKVTVYDFGANAHAIEQIQGGDVAGSSPFYPYTKVRAAFIALQLVRHGVEVDDYYPYAAHAPESMRPEGADIMFITPENVEEFSKQVAEY